jgi:radical SAM superfamily enzyme YgiQ (UPF0313 family)
MGVVDVAVKREGEPVINDILDRLGDPAALSEVPGLCYRANGDICDTGEAPYIEDLDALPPPNRALLPYQHYFSLLGGDAYSTTIFSSRGCPFHCAFCDRPALGKKFRCMARLRHQRSKMPLTGIREFFMILSRLTAPPEICRQIAKSVWYTLGHPPVTPGRRDV